MAQTAISFGDLVSESFGLLRQHAFLTLSSIIAMSAATAFLEVNEYTTASFITALVFVIFFQYLFTERMLEDRMSRRLTGNRRYLSLFGASMLSGLAIGFGLILLIVPGIYLSGRWMQSSAQVVGERKNATDALAASWSATRESQLAHFLAGFLMMLPTMMVVVAYVLPIWLDGAIEQLPTQLDTTEGIVAQCVTNSAVSILAWVIGIASYRLTDTSAPQAAVFE